MKNLKEYYQFVLTEAQKMEGEAPRDADFGRFAFAPTRQDTPTPKEPNTKSEDQALQALKTYFDKNQSGPLSLKAKQLWDLANQGYYSKVLSPGEYSTAYRILRMTSEQFSVLSGLAPEAIRSFGTMNAGTLAPKGTISGWTVNPKLFVDNDVGYGEGEVIALFIAPIEGNKFFGNPGFLAKAVGSPMFQYEMEVIALGPVQYSKCSYAKLTPYEMDDDDKVKVRVINILRNAGLR